jgi:hypothetical protein
VKHCAVEAARVIFLATHWNSEQALEEIGLELRDDGEGTEDVEDRRVMFDNADCGVPGDFAFAHITVAIAETSEPFGAFARRFAANAFFVVNGQLLVDDEKELLWGGGTEKFLRRLEDFECDWIARGWEEIVSSLSKAIELEGTAPRLWLAPGIEQTGVFHLVAQLLHTHVGHFETIGEFARVQSLTSLEFVENFQAGTAGDGFEKALFQRTDGLEIFRSLPPHRGR